MADYPSVRGIRSDAARMVFARIVARLSEGTDGARIR